MKKNNRNNQVNMDQNNKNKNYGKKNMQMNMINSNQQIFNNDRNSKQNMITNKALSELIP